MTTDQRIMLFSLFSRAMAASRVVGTIACDQERERITIKVLGSARSWSTFNNQDVDKMKGALLAIIDPTNLNAQVKQIRMPRTRTLYAIRQFDQPLWSKIAFGKFQGQTDLDLLTDEQLDQLRITLYERRRSKARKARHVEPEPEPEFANQPEIPF